MVKYYVSYGAEEKEGYIKVHPTNAVFEGEIEEVILQSVYEKYHKIWDLLAEIDKHLIVGGKIIICSPYFLSSFAWTSPLTGRCLSEHSLSWVNKAWREANKWADIETSLDYDVSAGVSFDEGWNLRSVEARTHATTHFANVIQQVVATLTKK